MSSSFRDSYLENYWPPQPNNPDMWQDNLELLQAYYVAARKIRTREGRRLETLDISTGPCLAPLMATMACIEHVQLSDFDESSREYLAHSHVDYWRRYAEELANLFPADGLETNELLQRLDYIRAKKPVLNVDLRRDPVFLPADIGLETIELMTMHFVVDSISSTSEECFDLLDKARRFIKPNGWLLLSALIDSSGWPVGEKAEPSPNLKEEQFDLFFDQRGDEVITRFSSTHKPNQIYDGRWAVFLVRKHAPSDVSQM